MQGTGLGIQGISPWQFKGSLRNNAEIFRRRRKDLAIHVIIVSGQKDMSTTKASKLLIVFTIYATKFAEMTF